MPRSPIVLVRWCALLLVLAFVALACSVKDDVTLPDDGATVAPTEPTTEAQILEGSPDAQADPTPQAPPTPLPQPTPIAEPPGRADLPEDQEIEEGFRLVVQSADGQLSTMLPDGTNVIPLTNPDEDRFNSVPVWSLDGSRLGWVSVDNGTDPAPQVRSAAFEGSQWFEFATAQPPFYLLWDPTSSQLATLSVGQNGFDLGVIDVGRGVDQRIVDTGAPFWFDWSPDADSFIVHASGLRLDLVPIDGPSQVIEEVPGSFQAPTWMNTDQPLIYADQVDNEQFLVVANPLFGGRRPLLTYDGYLQFVASEATGLMAVQVIDEANAPIPQVITASYQDDEFADPVDEIFRNQLYLMQVFGGAPFVISDEAARAFWWSPDGSRLAYLLEHEAGDGDCTSGTATYDLMVWDSTSGEYFFGPEIRPSETFACDYLPFFDQGTQGISYWAPDGSQFALPGELVATGESGIIVGTPNGFRIDTSIVSPGVFASFAPLALADPAASVL